MLERSQFFKVLNAKSEVTVMSCRNDIEEAREESYDQFMWNHDFAVLWIGIETLKER